MRWLPHDVTLHSLVSLRARRDVGYGALNPRNSWVPSAYKQVARKLGVIRNLPGVVNFTGFELDFDDLSALGVGSVGASGLKSSITYGIVNMGSDNEAFLPSIGSMLDGNNITRLLTSLNSMLRY